MYNTLTTFTNEDDEDKSKMYAYRLGKDTSERIDVQRRVAKDDDGILYWCDFHGYFDKPVEVTDWLINSKWSFNIDDIKSTFYYRAAHIKSLNDLFQ